MPDSHRQLWLRIPFSSPLLTLFPCQQHSLSRCVKCGHEYREHVRWASEKRKDRPFDKASWLTRRTNKRVCQCLVCNNSSSSRYGTVYQTIRHDVFISGGLSGLRKKRRKLCAYTVCRCKPCVCRRSELCPDSGDRQRMLPPPPPDDSKRGGV